MNTLTFPIASSESPSFDALRIVLVETSRPGNIGATARAMKTMGFSRLVLVSPRNAMAVTHEEAIAFASGAQDVLDAAQIVGSIDEALAGCRFAAAVSARLREFSPPIISPREFAQDIGNHSGGPVALVFGNERFGLPNDIVERCNALINIPANPAYASLNLAQAVQVLAYECRMALTIQRKPNTSIGFHGKPADVTEVAGMFDHLQQALTAIGFLDPANPKKLMPRLKRLFGRTQLEVEEVNILRGIAHHILKETGGQGGDKE